MAENKILATATQQNFNEELFNLKFFFAVWQNKSASYWISLF